MHVKLMKQHFMFIIIILLVVHIKAMDGNLTIYQIKNIVDKNQGKIADTISCFFFLFLIFVFCCFAFTVILNFEIFNVVFSF